MENLDQYAESYADSSPYLRENHGMLDTYVRFVLEAMSGRSKSDVLSLGIGHRVGSEAIVSSLGDRLNTYTIIEGSKVVIDEFRKKWSLSRKPTVIESYFELYRPAERFDVIDMGFVLEHVDDPKLILDLYSGFLKPGGMITIGVPNARSLHRLIGHHAGLLDDVYMLSDFDRLYGHKRFFDLQAITQLVESSGLKVRKTRGIMIKPVTTGQLESLKLPPAVWESLFVVSDSLPDISNALYLEVVN